MVFTLHDLGGSTRLDVRHEGWGEGGRWEEPLQGHFAGWLHGLALLGLFVETGRDGRARSAALRGAERYLISGEVPAAAAPVYRSLSDPAVRERWSDGLLDGAEVVEALEDRLLRWALPSGGELVAILRPTPRGTHVALAEHGVTDRAASARWPRLFDTITRHLALAGPGAAR